MELYTTLLTFWALEDLSIDWTGARDQTGGGDTAGQLDSCSDGAIEEKQDELLDAPAPNITEDLFGPIDRDLCPECMET